MRAQQRAELLFVLGIGIGVQKADRDGQKTARAQCGDELIDDVGFRQRGQHAAVRQNALVHFKRAAARNDRFRLLILEIVDVAAIMPLQLKKIAETGGGYEGDLGPLALKDRVGRDRRTVGEILDPFDIQACRTYGMESPLLSADGVLGTFVMAIRSLSIATRSVNVPPTSTPTLILRRPPSVLIFGTAEITQPRNRGIERQVTPTRRSRSCTRNGWFVQMIGCERSAGLRSAAGVPP